MRLLVVQVHVLLNCLQPFFFSPCLSSVHMPLFLAGGGGGAASFAFVPCAFAF